MKGVLKGSGLWVRDEVADEWVDEGRRGKEWMDEGRGKGRNQRGETR
jgi:hypothetical protein